MGWLGDLFKGAASFGLNTLTGGLGSAAVGALGNFFSGATGSMSQKAQAEWQEKMMKMQQDFNAQEAQKNRDFQAEQAEISRDWNSIGSQLNRASAAGVNPFALVNSGSYGSAGTSPTPSGGIASPASVGSIGHMDTGADQFNAVANAMQSLAYARQSGVETDFFERAVEDRLRKLSADATYQELLNDAQEIINDKLPLKVQRELAILFEKAANLSADTSLSEDKRRKIISETKEALSKVDVNDLTRQELQRLLDNYFDRLYDSIISRNEAEASQARSSAALMDVNRDIRDLDYSIRKASNQAEKEAAVAEFTERAVRAGIITDRISEDLKLAVKNNDWYVYDRIMSSISALAGAYGTIRGAGPAPVRESHTQTYEQGEYNGKPYWRETYQDSRR